MKSINYFRFLEKFPEYIDIEDTENVKLKLLSILKKQFWRKKEGDNPRLLPIKISHSAKLLRERGIKECNFKITFRGKNLMFIHIVLDTVTTVNTLNIFMFMSNSEFKNYKRNFILENILNDNK